MRIPEESYTLLYFRKKILFKNRKKQPRSLAGSADVQNVDPLILSDICRGLRNENPYCADLRFLGVEARARAERINNIPRMVDQVQHFDV
jgi:hypothetical protein